MEKNTVIAIVLSTIVLIVSFAVQNAMMQTRQAAIAQNEHLSHDHSGELSSAEQTEAVTAGTTGETQPAADVNDQPPASVNVQLTDSGPEAEEHITINTNTVTVVLTNKGGEIISWKLKNHKDKEEYVDMIFSGDNGSSAFSIALGGMEAKPISDLFYVNMISDYSLEFYRDIITPAGEKIHLIKKYDFKPNDYMFELTVTMEGANNLPYTLAFGPQIGPKFEKLDPRYDNREYYTYINGKRKKVKANNVIDDRPTWAAISGKYFVFIAIPHVAQYTISFTETPEPGVPSASRLSIARPAVNQRTVTESYKFYLGPKSSESLNVYHTGRNDFQFKDSSLVDAASSSGFWGPLVSLLKWILLLCYKITPNYGVAIILMTLLIKLVFFPLTKKSSEATSRMQELAPKIKEIQEKYKGNTQKLNAEMAAFYQKEGYNPLSGCLPMLLQIPIFIGMYQLFNNHFDLRGASFIPGWIPDLSVPEHIWEFPNDFTLPFFGWTALRALPFIYVGSQLMYGKFTQTPGQQSAGQMKMMMYVMPIVFFFILYNVPSGLLIYWIFSNIFTLIQQIIINKYKHAKAPPAEETAKFVIAPKKKKK